jgi:hypothetical protein
MSEMPTLRPLARFSLQCPDLAAPSSSWPSQLAIQFRQQRILFGFVLMNLATLIPELSPRDLQILTLKQRQSLIPLRQVTDLL